MYIQFLTRVLSLHFKNVLNRLSCVAVICNIFNFRLVLYFIVTLKTAIGEELFYTFPLENHMSSQGLRVRGKTTVRV